MKNPSPRPHTAGALLILAIGLGPAHALTSLEQRILAEPAPHTTAAYSETKVLVHYATLTGYLEGLPGNAERLAKLKDDADVCVKVFNGYGKPIQLPTEWPDYLNGGRTDTYVSERYSIQYLHTWLYAGYTEGCRLLEVHLHSAMLQSTAGACKIDFIQRTAQGRCNMAAHRAARPVPPMLPEPGPLQQVAGLRCGIRKLAGVDHCIAVDGRMKPTYALVLSHWSEHGEHYKATAAALDIEVSDTVFAPHLQAGFRVTEAP